MSTRPPQSTPKSSSAPKSERVGSQAPPGSLSAKSSSRPPQSTPKSSSAPKSERVGSQAPPGSLSAKSSRPGAPGSMSMGPQSQAGSGSTSGKSSSMGFLGEWTGAPGSMSLKPQSQGGGSMSVKSSRPQSQTPTGSMSVKSSRPQSQLAQGTRMQRDETPGSKAPASARSGGSSKPSQSSRPMASSKYEEPSLERPGSTGMPRSEYQSVGPRSMVPSSAGLSSRPPPSLSVQSQRVRSAASSKTVLSEETIRSVKATEEKIPGTKMARDNVIKLTDQIDRKWINTRRNGQIEIIITNTASGMPTFLMPSAPPGTPSLLRDEYDREMAAKQVGWNDMDDEARKVQDEWALEFISTMHLADACPNKRPWKRGEGGYQCHGNGHVVTDELLQEGKGGMICIGKDLYRDLKKQADKDRAKGNATEWGGKTELPNMWGLWDQWEGPYYYNSGFVWGDGEKGAWQVSPKGAEQVRESDGKK